MQLDVLLLADLGLRTVGRGKDVSAETRRVKVRVAQVITTES